MRIAAACLLAVGASSPLLYPEESSAGSGSGALAIVESLHGSLEARPETGETEAASFAHEGPDGRISAQAQGQALLLASLAAAAAPPSSADHLLAAALRIYNGWRWLCAESTEQQRGCQVASGSRFACGDGTSWRFERFPCLPHQSFDRRFRKAVRAGSLATADADAIVGMIVLVVGFDGRGDVWWYRVGQWAYDSCKAFLRYDTVLSADKKRLPRRGNCDGGTSCLRPGIFAPGHYKVMRQYLLDFSPLFGGEPHRGVANADFASAEGKAFASMFDALIETSYEVLRASQCPSTGSFPFEQHQSGEDSAEGSCAPVQAGDVSVAASGRVALHLTLDVAWFSDSATDSRAMLEPLALNIAGSLAYAKASCVTTSCLPFLDVDAACGDSRPASSEWVSRPDVAVPFMMALMTQHVSVSVDERALLQQRALTLLNQLIRATHAHSDGVGDLRWAALAALATDRGRFSLTRATHRRREKAPGHWLDLPRRSLPPPDPPGPPLPPSPPPPPPPPSPHPPPPGRCGWERHTASLIANSSLADPRVGIPGMAPTPKRYSDASACERLCDAVPTCQGYSWLGGDTQKAPCYLVSSARLPRERHARAVSGVCKTHNLGQPCRSSRYKQPSSPLPLLGVAETLQCEDRCSESDADWQCEDCDCRACSWCPFSPPSPPPNPPPPPSPPTPPLPPPAPSPPPACPLDITIKPGADHQGDFFAWLVKVRRWMADVHIHLDFGHAVTRIGHTPEAMLLGGEGESVLTFEVTAAEADGTAQFQVSGRSSAGADSHEPSVTCEGRFPPAPPPAPLPPRPTPLQSLTVKLATAKSSPPPSPPPVATRIHPPAPPPPACYLGITFESSTIGPSLQAARVEVTHWSEGATIRVDFGRGFAGRVDQGHQATLKYRSTSGAFDFELWERPPTRTGVDPHFDFYIRNEDSMAEPVISCDGWDPRPPPPHPPPSPPRIPPPPGRPRPSPPPPPNPPPPPPPPPRAKAQKSCGTIADEGNGAWPEYGEMCSAPVAQFPGCAKSMTLSEATHMCSSIGARICYPDELDGAIRSDDSCGEERMRVWTGTVCRAGDNVVGHITYGATRGDFTALWRTVTGSKQHPARCSEAKERNRVRCCAEMAMPPPSPPLVVPGAPYGLSLTEASCTALSVRWTGPPVWPPSGSTNFTLAWSSEGTAAATPSGQARYLSTGKDHAELHDLVPGTTYTLWVAARNALGLGQWSDPLRLATRPPTRSPEPPDAPVAVVIPNSCTSLRVRLPALRTGSCAGDTALALQVMSSMDSVWTTPQQTTAAETVLEGLDAAATYRLRLLAYNLAGASLPSSPTGPLLVGTTPQRLQAAPIVEATSSTTVRVSWANLAGPCTGKVLWTVMYLDDPAASWRVLDKRAAGTSLRGVLSCPLGCSFKVMPVVEGWAQWSNASRAVPTPSLPALAEGAMRVIMTLTEAPENLSFGKGARREFEAGLAHALSVSADRVAVVEARPLESKWDVIVDLSPPSTKAHFSLGVSASADELAVRLGARLQPGGGFGEENRFLRLLDLSAGLRRVEREEGSEWTSADAFVGRDGLEGAAPARVARASSGGGWRLAGLVGALMALCAAVRWCHQMGEQGSYERVTAQGDPEAEVGAIGATEGALDRDWALPRGPLRAIPEDRACGAGVACGGVKGGRAVAEVGCAVGRVDYL